MPAAEPAPAPATLRFLIGTSRCSGFGFALYLYILCEFFHPSCCFCGQKRTENVKNEVRTSLFMFWTFVAGYSMFRILCDNPGQAASSILGWIQQYRGGEHPPSRRTLLLARGQQASAKRQTLTAVQKLVADSRSRLSRRNCNFKRQNAVRVRSAAGPSSMATGDSSSEAQASP